MSPYRAALGNVPARLFVSLTTTAKGPCLEYPALLRPRSRILHPIWEGATGWIGTHRHSHKSQHLARNPYMSLAYISNVMNPVYVDCTAEWVDDPAQKQRIWDLFLNTPEPLGYDPAISFGSVDRDDFGLLKLTPWRIDLVTFPAPSMEEGTKVWRRAEA
jgi:hypothetical protein